MLALVVLAVSLPFADAPADSFVNFESEHVRPLALSPDGSRLFAVNTPDNRLAIFDIDSGGLTLVAEVVTGLEPVAVAARQNLAGLTEVWVVNHLSDSVSVVEIDPVDASLSRVTRTLHVGDEPRDIVFAGSAGSRAFVTTARRGQNSPVDPLLTTPGVGRALVWAFDANAPGAALGGTPLSIIELFGDKPRALAASADGSVLYAAIFHSGNETTTLHESVVAAGPGLPPFPAGSTAGAPSTGLIVRKNSGSGLWEDELGRDWSASVPFDLPDLDVFEIDANASPPALAPSPNDVAHVGTILFNMAVRPGNGKIYVGNLESRNHVRFEPLVPDFPTVGVDSGVQGHIAENRITIIDGSSATPVHLNPHIDYSTPTGPQAEIDQSLAFPLGMQFTSSGDALFVAAFGSGELAVLDPDDLEAGTVTAARVTVGRGPTGLVLDEPRDRVYVLDRFDHTISIVSDASDPLLRALSGSVSLGYDPQPAAVTDGRPFLYDARATSGHGDAACATCHVFGDFDGLAWDLGNPFGSVEPNPNPFTSFPAAPPAPPSPVFHPLKGPMSSQSLRGMRDNGPMHWRGDRTEGNDPGGDPMNELEAFKKFNPAFVGLLGRAAELPPADIDAFGEFALSLIYPPNPIRALDDVPTASQLAGFSFFNVVGSELNCRGCHRRLPVGSDGTTAVEHESIAPQEFKIPHLRNQYQKVGMFGAAGDQVRGFGFLHDGSVPTVFDFLQNPAFTFPFPSDVERRDVEAHLMSFFTGLVPAVGQQVSAGPTTWNDASVIARIGLLEGQADAGSCDLVVKGVAASEARGYLYAGSGMLQSDRSSEAPIASAAVRTLAATAGQEQTWTCTPPGSGTRIGIDRDEDGWLDRTELDDGTDPSDPGSGGPVCALPPDTDGDGVCDADDNCLVHSNLSQTDSDADGYGNRCDADYDSSGQVGIPDFNIFVAGFGLASGDAGFDPDLDHNDDLSVGIPDMNFMIPLFGAPPGPSGLACAGTPPCP